MIDTITILLLFTIYVIILLIIYMFFAVYKWHIYEKKFKEALELAEKANDNHKSAIDEIVNLEKDVKTLSEHYDKQIEIETLHIKDIRHLTEEIYHANHIIDVYKKAIIKDDIKYYECDYCKFVTQVPAHFCPACDKDNTGKTKKEYK